MFAYRRGRCAAEGFGAFLPRGLALVVLLALAGCASNQNYAAQNAAIAPRVAHVTEVEDDGLPAQALPPARIRDAPDDPSEPFSPNYGGANPSAKSGPAPERPRPVPAKLAVTTPPDDMPPAYRQKQLAAVNDEN